MKSRKIELEDFFHHSVSDIIYNAVWADMFTICNNSASLGVYAVVVDAVYRPLSQEVTQHMFYSLVNHMHEKTNT